MAAADRFGPTWLPITVFAVAVTGALAPQPAAAECGDVIAGAELLLRRGQILLLGEIHGTREIPAFVANLACRAAAASHPVLVGLEIADSEGAALHRYMGSEGTARDRTVLLSEPHWRREFQDGRSSVAILDLIESLRSLARSGRPVEVFAYDGPPDVRGSPRDEWMAKLVLARAEERPEAMVLILSGNLHNRTIRGLSPAPDVVPMGVHVQQGRRPVVSLNLRHGGGTAWTCSSPAPKDCGARPLSGASGAPGRGIVLRTDLQGYDGTYWLDRITASPPISTPTPAPPLDWTAPRRLVHVDNVAPEELGLFEDARRRWLAALAASGGYLPDGRPLLFSGRRGAGDAVVYTFYPFVSWGDLDARAAATARTQVIVGRSAVDDYDSGDAALVPPHYSELWSRLPSMDYVPATGQPLVEDQARRVRLEFRQLPVGSGTGDDSSAWDAVRKSLVDSGSRLTCRAWWAPFGRGQLALLWMAPDGAFSLDRSPTAGGLEASMPLQEAIVLDRRDDLSNLPPRRGAEVIR